MGCSLQLVKLVTAFAIFYSNNCCDIGVMVLKEGLERKIPARILW